MMVPQEYGPIRLSVHRKILLLLSDHLQRSDDFEVPDVLTQKGIGRELDLRQTHVSRALSELKGEGLISSRTAHVKDLSRRRKIYFLTQKGVSDITAFTDTLGSRRFPVRTEDRSLKNIPLGKATRMIGRITGHIPTFHEILTSYFDGSEIDVMAVEDDPTVGITPLTSAFYGREEELKDLISSIEDEKTRFTVIISIAGMGKTALLGKLISEIDGRPVSMTRMNSWTRPEKLLNDWARFLRSHGRTSLIDHLSSQRGFDIPTSVDRFQKDASGIDAVFILDDFQKSNEDVKALFDILKEESKGTKFILGSRERPAFYSGSDILVKKMVNEMILEGLDRDNSYRLLSGRGINRADLETAYDITKGHPLAMELLSELNRFDADLPELELDRYLREEIFKGLTPAEMGILNLAAVYDQPVMADGLLVQKGSSRKVLEGLCDRLLMRRYRDGTYDLHDLLRNHLRNDMDGSELEALTENALVYLSNRESEMDMMHHMVLLERSGRKKELDRLVLDFGESLLNQGHTQILDHVLNISQMDLKGLDLVKYLILSSDIDSVEGDHDRARKKLDRAMKICDDIISRRKRSDPKVTEQVSRILYRTAENARMQRTGEKTLDILRKNVAYNRKYGDQAGLGKALNNLSMTYIEMGEIEKAIEALEEARELFEGIGDPISIAFVEVNRADAYMARRDHGRAEMHLKKAESIQIKPMQIRGRIRRKMGISRLRMGKHKEAERDLVEAYRSFKGSRNDSMCSAVLGDLFRLSFARDDRKGAEDYLESMRECSDELTQVRYGFEHASRWNRKAVKTKAEDLSNIVMRSLPTKAAVTYIEGVIGEIDDQSAVEKLLYHSQRSFRKAGESQASIIISMWRADALIGMGKRSEAVSILKDSAALADKIGFRKAKLRIRERLKTAGAGVKKIKRTSP